jgi:hypothetical protein
MQAAKSTAARLSVTLTLRQADGAKFDGVFVLRTNTDLAPLDALLCYNRRVHRRAPFFT